MGFVVNLVQYLVMVVVPLGMMVAVVLRTRPGGARTLGALGFAMLTVAGLVGLSGWMGWSTMPPVVQPLLTFIGVMVAVGAVLTGSAQTVEEQL